MKAKIAMSAAVLALAAPLVMRSEGLRLDPYQDVGGILTVCYGETHGIKQRKYELKECRDMLSESMASHGADISACMPAGLPDNVQAAMLSFGYNVGAKSFCASTLAAKLRAGNTMAACAEMSRWIYAGGQIWPGLVTRRKAERELCEGSK